MTCRVVVWHNVPVHVSRGLERQFIDRHKKQQQEILASAEIARGSGSSNSSSGSRGSSRSSDAGGSCITTGSHSRSRSPVVMSDSGEVTVARDRRLGPKALSKVHTHTHTVRYAAGEREGERQREREIEGGGQCEA